MSEQELQIKLEEMRQNQQRWHDDFKQRENHWLYMRGFWLVSAGIAIGAILVKVL